MPSFEVWDVVKVPFPYVERPVSQYRPALVIADAREVYALLWVMMITSASHRRWPGDVEISDAAAAGLPIASIVRPAKLATVEANEAMPIGTLPVADREALSRYLRDRLRGALNSAT